MYMLHNKVLGLAFSIYLEISCLGSTDCVSSGFTSVWDTCLTAWTQPPTQPRPSADCYGCCLWTWSCC